MRAVSRVQRLALWRRGIGRASGGGGGGEPATETLTFDGVALTAENVLSYGTYADGSYWINGGGSAVSVTGITPASTTADRSISGGGTTGLTRVHGAMIDPGNADRYIATDVSTLALRQQKNYGFSAGTVGQGYDEWDATSNHDFDGALNVDPGFTGVPISLTQGTIVKAISKLSGVPSTARPSVRKLVPFTIVTSAPPANSFRPATALASKTANWTTADLNMARLPNLDSTGIAIPDYATTLAKLRYQSWQHTYNVLSRNIVGDEDNAPVYGGEFYEYTEAMLGLCFDTWTAPQKLAITTLLVQFAIDIAGRAVEGGIWQDNGGHCTARKALVTFAAYMLDDDPTLSAIIEYKALGANNGPKPTPVGASIWGDDTQHITITQAIIDEARTIPYTQNMLGWPEWGGDATRDPTSQLENHLEGDESLDTSNNGSYRHIIPRVNVPAALALRLMGAKPLFNNQVFFDYQDRYMTKRIVAGAALPGGSSNDITPWVIDAWEAARGTDVWSPALITSIIGQSENVVGFTANSSFYTAGPYPTLLAGVDAQIAAHAAADATDSPTIHIANASEIAAKTVSPGFVAMANLWHVGSGGRPLRLVADVVAGTSMTDQMDDAAGDGREFSDSVALVALATAAWGPVQRVTYNWYNAEAGAAKTLWASRSAHFFGINSDGSDYDFTAGPLDHCLIDTTGRGYGLLPAATKVDLMLPGHRVQTATALNSPPNINYKTDGAGSAISGMIEQNSTPAYAQRDAFLTSAPAANRGAVTIAPSLVRFGDYSGGVQLAAPAQTSIHPSMKNKDGQILFSQDVAASFLIAEGHAEVSRLVRVEQISLTTFDFVFSIPAGGTLLTQRILDGETVSSPRPHQQEVMGFVVARGSDTDRQMRPLYRTDNTDDTLYPVAYRGTATIIDNGTNVGGAREAKVRVVMGVALTAGDRIHFGTDGGYGGFILHGWPDYDANLYRDGLRVFESRLDDGSDTRYPGIPVRAQEIYTVTASVSTWNVSGGVTQIVVTSMPTVAAPVASGGATSITVTG